MREGRDDGSIGSDTRSDDGSESWIVATSEADAEDEKDDDFCGFSENGADKDEEYDEPDDDDVDSDPI